MFVSGWFIGFSSFRYSAAVGAALVALLLAVAGLTASTSPAAAATGPADDLDELMVSIQAVWNDGGPAVVARSGNSTSVRLDPVNDEGWWQHHWTFEAVDASAGIYRIKNRSTHPEDKSYLSRSWDGQLYLAAWREESAQQWQVTKYDDGGWIRYRLTSRWESDTATLSVPGFQNPDGTWERGTVVALDSDWGSNSQRFTLPVVTAPEPPEPEDPSAVPAWLGDLSVSGDTKPSIANAIYVDCDSGDDDAAGSASAPWRTLPRIGSQAPGTDVVIDGFCEGQQLRVTWSGTPADPVVVTGADAGNRPVLKASADQVGEALVLIKAGNVQLWDVILDGEPSGDPVACPQESGANVGYLVGVDVRGDDNTVARVDASGFYAGVFVYDRTKRNRVIHSALHGNDIMTIKDGENDDAGAIGVLVRGGDTEIAWNYFANNRGCSPDYWQDGASIEVFNGSDTYAHDNYAWNEHHFAELGEGEYEDKTLGKSKDNRFERNYHFSDFDAVSYRNKHSHDAFLVTRWGGEFGDIDRTVVQNNDIRMTGHLGAGVVCVDCVPEALSMGGNTIETQWHTRAIIDDGGGYTQIDPLPGGVGPGSGG